MYEMTDFLQQTSERRSASRFPAVIERAANGKYICRCGAVPVEVEGKQYDTPGACLVAILASEGIKTGQILRVQELCDGRNVMWEPRADGQFVARNNK
jgi:hypothetical protein